MSEGSSSIDKMAGDGLVLPLCVRVHVCVCVCVCVWEHTNMRSCCVGILLRHAYPELSTTNDADL